MIAALAGRQHGRVARRQLLALGVGSRAIEHRIAAGRLHVEHPGVYAVGHATRTRRGGWMAAVLAAGPGAALSHRSASALHGVRSEGGRIEATVPGRRRAAGLALVVRALPPDETTVVDGIPVTTVPRTLLDLAEVLDRPAVEAAVNEAEYLELTDPLSLADLLARHPRHRGARTIAAIVDAGRIGLSRTRGEFEELLLPLVDRAGLPRPICNHPLGIPGHDYHGDAAWPTTRVVLELDGWRSHGRRVRFESDRARDRHLTAAGWRVVRVTWRQLEREPAATIAADLAAVLRA